jgi:WD40 repeat protein
LTTTTTIRNSITTKIKFSNSNLTQNEVNKTLQWHSNDVYAITTLPNGDLISGSSDKTIKIWNPNDGKLKRTINGHTHYVRALTTLPNGDLVSGSDDMTIKIWNQNDGSENK